MIDDCGHVIAALLCKTCVERDFEAQKELTAFYVDKLNKAEAENERLREYHDAAEYGFSVREPWQCLHPGLAKSDCCAACKLQAARKKLSGGKSDG